MSTSPPITNYIPDVSINGKSLPVYRWHCTRPAYGSVGSFRLYMSREVLRNAGVNIYQIGYAAVGQVPVLIKILDLDTGDEHLLFGGELDSVEVEYDTDTVIVNGRDWAGLLVDQKGSPTQRTTVQVGSGTGASNAAVPCNSAGKMAPTGVDSVFDASSIAVTNGINIFDSTPSKLAYQIAVRNGYKPVIYQTPNEQNIGVFMNGSSTLATEVRPWWEWLQFLARFMGWNCYVTPDRSLYFGPFDLTNTANLSWGVGNLSVDVLPCKDLHITYNPRRNSSFLVLVGSHDNGTAAWTVGAAGVTDQSTTQTLQTNFPQLQFTQGKYLIGAAGAASPFTLSAFFTNLGKPVYYYQYKNLVANQTAAKALELMLDIAKRELILKATVDGNVSIVPMQTINVTVGPNLATDFPNTQYYIHGVEHTYSVDEGWYTHISAWTLPPVTSEQFLQANNINGVSVVTGTPTLYNPSTPPSSAAPPAGAG